MIEKIEDKKTIELNIKFWIEPVTVDNARIKCKEFVKQIKKIFREFKFDNKNFKKFFFTDTNFSLKSISQEKKTYFKQTYIFHKKENFNTDIEILTNNLKNYLDENKDINIYYMKSA